jgi:streptogramin lyase
MHQGHIAKIDGKTKEITDYPIPEKWQSLSTQESMVSPQFSNVDGKVWTNNQDDHSILRLDVKTGEWENFGGDVPPEKGGTGPHILATEDGKTIRGYGIPPDRNNNLYILQFAAQEIGFVDAKTGKLEIYKTPFPRSRPRRGAVDSQNNLWFAEYGGDGVGMFDPKTKTIKEWVLPIKHSSPYDVVRSAKGDVYTGSMFTDRVTRLNPDTGEFIDYLMPIEVNIRRVFFDDRTNTFWIGANLNNHIVKVEPLD